MSFSAPDIQSDLPLRLLFTFRAAISAHVSCFELGSYALSLQHGDTSQKLFVHRTFPRKGQHTFGKNKQHIKKAIKHGPEMGDLQNVDPNVLHERTRERLTPLGREIVQRLVALRSGVNISGVYTNTNGPEDRQAAIALDVLMFAHEPLEPEGGQPLLCRGVVNTLASRDTLHALAGGDDPDFVITRIADKEVHPD